MGLVQIQKNNRTRNLLRGINSKLCKQHISRRLKTRLEDWHIPNKVIMTIICSVISKNKAKPKLRNLQIITRFRHGVKPRIRLISHSYHNSYLSLRIEKQWHQVAMLVTMIISDLVLLKAIKFSHCNRRRHNGQALALVVNFQQLLNRSILILSHRFLEMRYS